MKHFIESNLRCSLIRKNTTLVGHCYLVKKPEVTVSYYLEIQEKPMFSATQQIETAAFTSLKFRKNQNEKFLTSNNARPSRWSLSKIAELEPKRFIVLCHWYTEHTGFDGHVHIETNTQPVDVKQARDLLIATQESSGAHIMLITSSRFSSGSIDFCKNRRIDLVTNKDLFRAVASTSINEQQQLLDQIFKI